MSAVNQNSTTDYSIFNAIFTGENICIRTSDIKKENWNSYCSGLLDVFKDCIEQRNLHGTFISFMFDDGSSIQLTAEDSLINIIMWGFIINTGGNIKPYHVFYEERGITAKSIKRYIDNFCIIPNRNSGINIYELNNIIYTTLRKLTFVDNFSMYFNNSINLEDFIDMAIASEEFNSLIHKDYSHYPPDEMNNAAQKDTERLIELILDSKRIMGREHCLIDALRAREGVKPKQLREFAINIGVKPNGLGGVFPYTIDNSYMNGGLNRIEYMLAESKIGRLAQIINKKNTSDSGTFARVLGLNNIDSKLYANPRTGKYDYNYDCHTSNFIEYEVSSMVRLIMIQDRYYRFNPNGIEYNVGCGDKINTDLIGKTIYLRSPITCASASKGLGICRKCYGELYRINQDVNIGKIAAEEFSSRLTQTMLSAKHLLEAKVYIPEWDCNIEDYVVIDDNYLYINPELQDSKKWSILIDIDKIEYESVIDLNDDDNRDENLEISKEYINIFTLVGPNGEHIDIHTTEYDNLYITDDFNILVRIKKFVTEEVDSVCVPLDVLIENEIALFEIGIYNDDMSSKLKKIKDTINLKSITENYSKDEFLEHLLELMIDIGLGDIHSVHAEVIIMNQIRDAENILLNPDWDSLNPKYKVLTLRKAIECNPRVTVSCQFDNLSKILYTPSTFKKKAPSVMDLFYNVRPQAYIKSKPEEETRKVELFKPLFRNKK